MPWNLTVFDENGLIDDHRFKKITGTPSTEISTASGSASNLSDVMSFDERVTDAGSDLVLSTNFPDSTHISSHWHKNDTFPEHDTLIYDTTQKVSGGGSARFTATSDAQNDWRINMSETPGSTVGIPSGTDEQFGLKGLARDLGDVCCIQFRWRGDSTLLNTVFNITSGRGGWKIMNFSKGDEVLSDSSQSGVGSNQRQEIVLNNAQLSLLPQLYTDGSGFYDIEDDVNTTGASWTDSQGRLHTGQSFDAALHNAHTPGDANIYLNRALLTGMRDFNGDATFGSNTGAYQLTYDTLPAEYLSRFKFFHPDEWMTIQIRITLGPLGTASSSIDGTQSGWTESTIEMWVARDNEASVKVIEKTGIVIARSDGASNTRDGLSKLWFTKFHTGLGSAASPDGYFWIDELIVSKSIIPDPATGINPPGSATSRLATLVDAMDVDEWVLFQNTWDTNFWIGGSYHNLEFSHVGAHDPERDKITFIGASYGNTGVYVYDITADEWTKNEHGYNVHTWDHLAYDNVRGVSYYGAQAGNDQRSTPIGNPSSVTTGLPEPTPGQFGIDTYGMEYWPELDSVMFYDSREGTILRRPIGSTISSFGSGGASNGNNFHPFLTYNPVRNVMYFGGGQSQPVGFNEISASGVISSPPNTGNPGIDCVRQKAMCGDVTGDLVVLDFPAGETHAYVHGSGWGLVSNSMPTAAQESQALTAAIPLRGFGNKEIFMTFTDNSGGGGGAVCYLYRYS